MLDAFASFAAFATVAGVTGLAGYVYAGRQVIERRTRPNKDPSRVFVFQGVDLVDASVRAKEILDLAPRNGSDWDRLTSHLASQFPGITERLNSLDENGSIGLRSSDGAQHLTASSAGPRVRITLNEYQAQTEEISVDPFAFNAMQSELNTLRAAAEEFPFLAWRETEDGEFIWANRAYLRLSGDGWPPPRLFCPNGLRSIAEDGTTRRMQVIDRNDGGRKTRWYECRAVPHGKDRMNFAVPIDSTIEAEQQLRDFMQTLTKTFSHLTTGLAVFDRQRRLVLFNPALTDLTGLPVDFLAARPTLYGFLDRLRDKHMIPEPRDYGSWRRQIAELESAALDGTYSETWSLPDNRTYQVSGRPHHGGALALLIEDISTEITLTRRFRKELELGQAVIDAVDTAIVVFSPTGELTMVNQAYEALWDTNTADHVSAPSIGEVSNVWAAQAPSAIWTDMRDMVLRMRARTNRTYDVVMPGRGLLRCKISPVSGGSTLVSFRLDTEAASAMKLEPMRA